MHGEEEGMVEEVMGAPAAGTAEEDGGWEAFYNRFKDDQRVRRELELDRGLREFLKSPEARDEDTAFRRLDEYSRARFGLDAERGDAWNADRKPFATASQYADALVGITRRGYEAVATDEWRAWTRASREERMRIAGVNPNKAAASDETPGAFATADAFAFQRVVPKTDEEIDAEIADYGARIEGQNFLGVMRAYDARFGFTPDERALVRAALRHGDGLPEEMAWDFERVLRADPERGRALKDLVDRTRRTERRWWRDNAVDPFVGGFERIRRGLEDAFGEFAGPMALEAQMRALVGGSADSGRWWWNDAERAEYARLKDLYAADARVRAYAAADPKRLVDNMCARRLALEAVPAEERRRARRERVILEDALSHKPTVAYGYASRTLAGVLSTLPYMAVTAAPYAGFAANVLSQFETVRDGIILDGGDEDEAVGAQLLLAAGWAGIEKAQLGHLFGKPLTGLRRKAMLAKIYKASWEGGRLAKIGAYARQGAKEAVVATLAESMEEGLQGALEAGEMEWFAGRGGGHDGVATLAAALKGGAGDFVESLGTMGVLSLVGAGVKVGRVNRDARGADSLAEYAAAALRAKNVLRGTVMDPERPGADVPEAARRAVQEVWSIWRRHAEDGTGGVAALDEIRERYGLDEAQTRDVGDWLDLRDNLVEAARYADTDEEGRFVAGVAGGMFRIGAPGSHLDAQALYDVVLPGTKVEEVEIDDPSAAPAAPVAEAAPSAELAAAEEDVAAAQAEVDAATVGSARRGAERRLRKAKKRLERIMAKAPAPEAAPKPTRKAQKVTLPTGESYILDIDASSPDIDSKGWAQSVEQAMREAFADPALGEDEKPSVDGRGLSLDAFRALPADRKADVAVTTEQYLSMTHAERESYCGNWDLGEGARTRILDETGRELLGADGVVTIKNGFRRFVHRGGNWELAHEHGHFIAAVASRHMTPGQIATMRRLFGDPTSENERWNEENANNQFAEWLRGKYDFRVFTPEERRARMNWFQRVLDTIKHLFWLSGERPPAAPVEVTQRGRALDAAFNALRSGDFSGLDVYAGIDFAEDHAGKDGKDAAPDARRPVSTASVEEAGNPAPEAGKSAQAASRPVSEAPAPKPAAKGAENPLQRPESASAPTASADFQAGYDAAVAAMNANPGAFADGQSVRTGGKMTVFTPDYSMKVEAEPMWTPLASLVESTDDREVQMRDRTRAATDEQTHSKTRPGVFQPLALFPGSKSDDGAPIVGGGNRIISGHGRKRMLDILAQEGRFGEYLDAVAAEAARRGLTPPPDGMENPVLVLRVTGGLDRREDLVRFAELSNRWGGLERSGAEFAESDARKITDALLRLYAPDASGNLLAASNRPFMAAFLKAVGATGLTNADGTPTPEAALRVQRALMTAVFGNDEKVRSMVQSLLERSQELSLASLQNALMRSAGRLLAMKRQKGSFDIVADVREAAYQYIAWRVAQQKSPKLTLAEHLRQSDFFAAEVPPMQQALARLLDAERFGKALEKYSDLVAQQAVDAQSTFGFFEAKTPLQLLGEAERALLEEGETPVTPDPASPEAAAPEQTPPAVQAEPAPTPEAEPADPVEAAQAEIAPPEPETFVPVPAVRGTATLPGPGAEGVKAHQVNADGRPTTAVRTLPPGAWNLLRAPYDVRRPPKPSAQDRAGRGLGISAPPPATDSRGRYWGKVFPHFQGNKAEMADRTSQAIRKTMTKAERDHYSTVVDYFGGGGCWGLYHALTNFENARQLVVNEFDPDRLEKIRLLHEIDGQVADEAARIIKEPKTYARIKQLVGETSSPQTIASRVQSYLLEGKDEADAAGSMFVFGDEIRKVTDPRERAVLKAFVDCAQTMFATVKDEDGKPVEDPMAGIDKALDALREDGRKAKEAADAFKARGGSISYRAGDAAAFDDAPSGHQVVAVCDPPYYLTQDYQQNTILGLDPVPDNWSYAATRDLLRQLVDRGDAIVYTDEAWWNKESYTPDRRERNGVSTFGKEQQTLLDIINTLDHFDVAGRVVGRQETLGIHHGHATDGKPEGGAGRADVRDDRADDARGGDDGARPSVRRVAGDLEGEGRAARGTRPHRGREGRVAIAREVIVQDIASSVEEASPVSDPAAVDALVRHSVRSVREDRMADYAKTVSRNAKAWLRRRTADLDKQMAAAGYTEKVWHGTEGKDFNVFKFSAESHGVPAAYFTYKRETAQNYAAIRGMDAAMDGDYGQINTRQFYVNPGKVLDYDEAKTPLDFDGVLKMLKKAYEDGYNAVRCHNILDDQGARLDENDENMTFLAPEDAPGNGEGDFITDTLIVLQQPGDNAAARIKAADPVTFLDELPIPPEMRGNASFADVRFSVQMGSRDEQYRYGIGSSLLNGEGFVDLEKGDTYRAIEEAVRTEVGKEVTNETLGVTAKIGSNANANHIVSKMSAFGDEDSEAHKYAAKNILSLFEKAAIGIVHHDKKGTPNDYIRAFAPFHFAGRVELATITLRRDKGGNRLYTVEAVETGTGSSPRSSWRTTQGAQLPVSLDDRIAYYVGDVNRTQPAFIGRDAGIPFTPESLKLKIDIELEKLETLDKTNANRQPQEVEPRHSVFVGAKSTLKGAVDVKPLEKAISIFIASHGKYTAKVRDEIWAETGWWIGTDGRWRFEIRDVKPRRRGNTDSIGFTVNGLYVDPATGERGCPITDMVSHAQLFRAYPQLKDITVRIVDPDDVPYIAEYDPATATLRLNWDAVKWFDNEPSNVLTEDGLRTVTHELQHAVQGIENFARGGSPEYNGQTNYSRLAGEVESRNAERRFGMFPELTAKGVGREVRERYWGEGFPWNTEDVPRSRQIIVDGHGRMTDANGRPVARSSATRRRSVGLANVATALFAQQLLAGKEVSAEDADSLLRNIGLGALPAPALLTRAKELAEANREKVQRLVRDNAPGLVAALAQNGLEAQFRDAIDGAVTGTAKAVDPSVGQRLQKAIQSKETRELMAAKGFDAAQMMAELPIDLPRGILATADRVKTPEERAKLEEARKRREEERAAAEAEMTDEERLAAVDDPTYVPPSEESLALFRQLYDSAKFALEARQAEERRAAAEKAKRKAEGSQQDESGEAADAAGSVPSAQADADEFLPAETVQRIAPVFDSPELFAQFLVEWTAKHVVEKHPDIPSTAQMWKNPVAIRELKQTATGILRKLARDCLGSPSLNYARNFVDHQINELESDAETRTYKSVLRKVAYVYDAIHENALRLKRRELVNRLVNGYRAKNPETGKTETVPGIRQLAGVKGRFSAVKEEFQRAIDARTEVWARQLVPLLTMGEERLASEIAEMERRLAADPTADDYVPMDDDARREMADRLALARKYGCLVRRMPGEIADAADEILSDLNGKRQAFEQRRLERENEDKVARDAIVDAMRAGSATDFRKPQGRLGRYADAMQGNLTLEMQNLVRFCRDPEKRQAALEAIETLQAWISEATGRYRVVLGEAQRELREGLAACYGSAEEGIRHLLKDELDPETAAKIFKSRDKVPTYGQLLQLYASSIQSDYRENAEKHGRTAALPIMEQTLTDADKAFHAFAVEWYKRNRRALSDAVEAVTGLPVTSPDALYCPVRVQTEADGFSADAVAWSPVPAALNRRVRHGLDFNEGVNFLSVLQEQAEIRAQTIGYSAVGIRLRDILAHRETQKAARETVGKRDIKTVLDHVKDVLVQNAARKDESAFFAPLNLARKWIARFALAGNVPSAIKQLASMPVWANAMLGGHEIGLRRTMHYLATVGTDEGRAAIRDLAESDGFKARYTMGWSEETQNILMNPSKSRILRYVEKAYDKGMIVNKAVDAISCLWMAQGFYRDARAHFLSKGLAPDEAKRMALAMTWSVCESGQQSGRIENMNSLQRKGGAGVAAIFQFKTAYLLQNAYLLQAIREWRAGTPGAMGRAIRAAFINCVWIPAFVQCVNLAWSALMGDEPPEEDPEKWPKWLKDFGWSMIDGVTAPMFGVSTAAHTAYDAVTGNWSWSQSSGIPAIDSAIRVTGDAVRSAADLFKTVTCLDAEEELTSEKLQKDVWRLLKDIAAPVRHGKRAYDNRWGEGAR